MGVLLVALFVTACSSSGESTEDAVDPDRLTKQIDAYLDSKSWDEVRAVSVSAGGETVVEMYRDADPKDYWDVESVTKSVISILVGIALDEGYLAGTDQTLAEAPALTRCPDELPGFRGDPAPATHHDGRLLRDG